MIVIYHQLIIAAVVAIVVVVIIKINYNYKNAQHMKSIQCNTVSHFVYVMPLPSLISCES